MDRKTVNAPSRRGIAQTLPGRADQGGPTVALIKKLHGRWHAEATGADTLVQGGHLAGNGVRFGWLL
jgi:hypothetical protein